MFVDREKLKEFLLDSGLVSRADIDRAEKDAKKNNITLEKAVLNLGELSLGDIRRAEAYILGIPFVNLKEIKIDYNTLSLIPEPIARKHNIIAFRKTPDALEVAMLDADDLAAADFVRKKTGMKIVPRLAEEDGIKAALLQYQKSLKAEFGDVIQKEIDLVTIPAEKSGEEVSGEDLKKLAEDLPVVRIVDTLLNH